jgi:hypothetical protein
MDPTTTTAAPKSYLIEEFSKSQKLAQSRDLEVIHSTADTLLIDLDTGTQQDQFRVMLGRAQNIEGLKGIFEKERWVSKSGHGVHVVVQLPHHFSVAERLLLQACLGSDPMRELLGMFLERHGEANPIMLFKPKVKS